MISAPAFSPASNAIAVPVLAVITLLVVGSITLLSGKIQGAIDAVSAIMPG